MGLTTSSTRQGRLLRSIHEHRSLIGLSYTKLGIVALLSVLAGFAQAALLLVIVRGATALTADTEIISGSVGPFTASGLTTTQLIAWGFGILCALLVFEVATSLTQASLSTSASRTAQHRMLRRFAAADYEAQTERPRGETSQIVMAWPTQAGSIAASLGSGLSAALNFSALVIAAVVLSPIATGVGLIGLLVMIAALRPLLHLTRRLSDRRTREQRRLGALTAERLELGRELKAAGAESRADQLILDAIDRITHTNRRIRFVTRMSSVTYRLGAFALVLAMLTMINAVDSSNLAALTGALLMLLRSLSYGQAAQSSYQTLGEIIPTIDQLAREDERLAAAAEPTDSGVAPIDFHVGAIELDRVEFGYTDDEPVLTGASLRIEPGEFIALVGPSGAGKSTLMQLLLRLRQPSAGSILIDGRPADEVPLDWWRQRVGFVAQEPKLQSGSVSDAIRFGRADLTEYMIRRAAAQAHIADEIESWPAGWDTQVGQLGEGVSGGQRQRIALARALAGHPDVLLLDEPTSALDPLSERLVARTLDELRGRMTIVVIAHRIQTVESADRAIRLEQGRVVDHDEHDRSILSAIVGVEGEAS